MKKTIFLGIFFSLFVATLAVADATNFLFPISDGYYKQWVPKSGTVHYTQVDENPCNGTTDYVQTSTIGKKDSFSISLASIPDGAVITSINAVPCASQVSSGGAVSSKMSLFYRYNGVDSLNSPNYSLSGSVPQVLSTTTFSSLGHVKTSTSTLEIGAIYVSGTRGARLSNIKAGLTYFTPPSAPYNLTATSTPMSTSTVVSLNWVDNSNNEDAFKIEKSTNNIDFSLYSIVPANLSSTAFFLGTSGYHYFRVKASNLAGDSLPSNTASVFIP